MNRRTSLKSFGALATLAVGLPHARPAVASRPKTAANTLKGLGVNDEPSLGKPSPVSGQTVYQYLSPAWMFYGWQWAAGNTATYPCGWVIQLDDAVPTSAQLQAIINKQNYQNGGRLWMLLNEQNESGMTPPQAITIAKAQQATVLAVDSQARFALSLGSQNGAPQGDTLNWGGTVWQGLDGTFKSHLISVFTHWYPQVESGDPNVYLSEVPALTFFQGLVSWRAKYAQYALVHYGLELWITEYGLDMNAAGDARSNGYAWLALDAMRQAGIARAAPFRFSDLTGPNYTALVTGNNATVTLSGKTFASI